jgi:predicted dehydrogenase
MIEAHFDFSHLTADHSQKRELEEFLKAIQENRALLRDGHDGLQTVRLAWALYEAFLGRKVVSL